VVVVEGDGAAVIGPVVGLDDDALAAPKEVDGPAAELDVDLGRRDAVAVRSDKREEEGLEVRAGAVALGPFEVVAFELCLADDAA
jgi:hypothetical protein